MNIVGRRSKEDVKEIIQVFVKQGYSLLVVGEEKEKEQILNYVLEELKGERLVVVGNNGNDTKKDDIDKEKLKAMLRIKEDYIVHKEVTEHNISGLVENKGDTSFVGFLKEGVQLEKVKGIQKFDDIYIIEIGSNGDIKIFSIRG